MELTNELEHSRNDYSFLQRAAIATIVLAPHELPLAYSRNVAEVRVATIALAPHERLSRSRIYSEPRRHFLLTIQSEVLVTS